MDVIAAAVSTAPWWGSGLFTLLGAVLGGVIVQAGNIYINRRRNETERTAAERTLRREALITFLSAGHEFIGTIGEQRLANQAAFYSGFVRLRLMVNMNIQVTAQRYLDAVQEAERSENSAARMPAIDMMVEAESALIAVVRKDYGSFGLPAA